MPHGMPFHAFSRLSTQHYDQESHVIGTIDARVLYLSTLRYCERPTSWSFRGLNVEEPLCVVAGVLN